jgi:hypothetical protein
MARTLIYNLAFHQRNFLVADSLWRFACGCEGGREGCFPTTMSRQKPWILFLLLGVVYPLSLFGWAREEVLETAWGPVLAMWAFAVGLGALGATLERGPGRRGTRRMMVGAALLLGYAVSGALGAGVAGSRGWLGAAVLGGAAVLAVVWSLAVRGARRVPDPASA